MTTPPFRTFGTFILGCGTFGGIGGSAKLVGRGLDEPSAFATMDEAVRLGITLFDTTESYVEGASETMIGRWPVKRDSTVTDSVLTADDLRIVRSICAERDLAFFSPLAGGVLAGLRGCFPRLRPSSL